MSRIGKKPIPIPKGVTVKIEGNTIAVQGPKGKLDTELPSGITIEQKDGIIVAVRQNDSQAALHGLARALVNKPLILMADEPTGNLDSKTSDEIMALLSELNGAGKTIIMVTHENDIAAWARRVVRMRDGHIESDVRNDPAPVTGVTV